MGLKETQTVWCLAKVGSFILNLLSTYNMDSELQLVAEIIQSRKKDIPELIVDRSNIPQALISIFTTLDERYFDLTNEHIGTKETLSSKQEELQSIKEAIKQLNQQMKITKDENQTLRKQIMEKDNKLHEIQESNLSNIQKLNESSSKISQQENLLSKQSQQLYDLANKCSELEHLKYSLQQKFQQASNQKELMKVSLHKQLAEIQQVRQRQKTQIKDVTQEIQMYYQQMDAVKNQKIILQNQLSETEKQVQVLQNNLDNQKKINQSIRNQINILKEKQRELEENTLLLSLKEKELENMKGQYSDLKEKQGNYDIIVQNLSSQKEKLNRQINRITMEAKARRKQSDNQSINTDTAFQHVTQSFRMSGFHNAEEKDLNRSMNQYSYGKKLSVSFNGIPNGSNDGDVHESKNQKRIAQLEKQRLELELVISSLKQQLEVKNSSQTDRQTSQEEVIRTVDDQELIIDRQNLCESREQAKEMSISKYEMQIKPQIKLLSLYSMSATKLKPKQRMQTAAQTTEQKRQDQIFRPYNPIKLSFDEVEISASPKTSQIRKQQSFFDRLSRLFCGGPQH